MATLDQSIDKFSTKFAVHYDVAMVSTDTATLNSMVDALVCIIASAERLNNRYTGAKSKEKLFNLLSEFDTLLNRAGDRLISLENQKCTPASLTYRKSALTDYAAKHPENVVWTPETGWTNGVEPAYNVELAASLAEENAKCKAINQGYLDAQMRNDDAGRPEYAPHEFVPHTDDRDDYCQICGMMIGAELAHHIVDVSDQYEIIDHGVEHSQYFQGCGVSFTPFEHVSTGIGYSYRSALQDAADNTENVDQQVSDAIEADIASADDTQTVQDDSASKCFHHVSIRYGRE